MRIGMHRAENQKFSRVKVESLVAGATLVAAAVVLVPNAAADPPTTATVNVELQSHTNSILDIPNNGSVSYYSGGWHTITTKNPNDPKMMRTSLAPGTYTFALVYNGTRDTKTVTVSGNKTVYFHAAAVSVELQSHTNSILDIPNNGSASYYAAGWRSITTINPNNHGMVQAEMLPGTYTFAATYNGTRDTKTYTVIEPNPNNHANARQTVYFHAVQVISDSGTADSYYASGWRSFSSGDNLLPGTYTFHFTGGGGTSAITLTWAGFGNASVVHIA